MTAPVLITLAVLLPVVLFVGLFGFTKGTIWLGSRPRMWAAILMVYGLAYAAGSAWSAREDFDTEAIVSVLVGVSFFVGGTYHWFRGRAVDLE